MAANDTTAVDAGQEPAPDSGDGQPQAGDATSTTSTTDASAQAADTPDADALRRELAEARKEAAKYRTERNAAAKRAEELEQAQMSEAEKIAKRADDAEKRVAELEAREAERQVRDAVYQAAEKLNVVSPSDVYALVRDDITQAGDAADIPSIVKAAVDSRTYLLRQPASTGASGAAGRDAAEDDMSPSASRARLGYGRATEIWDARLATQRGGGVQISSPHKVERR